MLYVIDTPLIQITSNKNWMVKKATFYIYRKRERAREREREKESAYYTLQLT